MSVEQLLLFVVLVAALVVAAMWTAVTTRLLRAAVGLALTSAVLAVVMFLLNAPLAAVFELSVCAGLIPAIFLSAISVTRRLSPQAAQDHARVQIRKYWPLPLIVGIVGFALTQVDFPAVAMSVATGPKPDVREALWNFRHLELVGQIVILLAGAFGVAVLLKESKHE